MSPPTEQGRECAAQALSLLKQAAAHEPADRARELRLIAAWLIVVMSLEG